MEPFELIIGAEIDEKLTVTSLEETGQPLSEIITEYEPGWVTKSVSLLLPEI
jgi:hypothetical protein